MFYEYVSYELKYRFGFRLVNRSTDEGFLCFEVFVKRKDASRKKAEVSCVLLSSSEVFSLQDNLHDQ